MFRSLFRRNKSKRENEAIAVVTSTGRTVIDADELLWDAAVRRFLNRLDSKVEAARQHGRERREAQATR